MNLINVTQIKRRNDEISVYFIGECWKTIAHFDLYLIYTYICKIIDRITHVLLKNVLHVDIVALSRQEREKDHQTYEFE